MPSFSRLHGLGVFWAMPPTRQDFLNAEAAEVSFVVMPAKIAMVCWRDLTSWGRMRQRKTWLILRVEEDAYYGSPDVIASGSRVLFLCSELPVTAIICGNEPQDYDLTATSTNWGNQPEPRYPKGRVWEHKYWLQYLRDYLWDKVPSVPLLSPGWVARQVATESAQPEPGRDMWAGECAYLYSSFAGGCLHVYEYNWPGMAGGSEIDLKRFTDTVRAEMDRLKRMGVYSVWCDEANILHGTDQEQAGAFIGMVKTCEAEPSIAERLRSLCLFCGTGDPGHPEHPAWPANYLVKDPSAYQAVGSFVRELHTS